MVDDQLIVRFDTAGVQALPLCSVRWDHLHDF